MLEAIGQFADKLASLAEPDVRMAIRQLVRHAVVVMPVTAGSLGDAAAAALVESALVLLIVAVIVTDVARSLQSCNSTNRQRAVRHEI